MTEGAGTPAPSSVGAAVAVAIDKNKNSQAAFKWALDRFVSKGQAIFLVHVKTKHSSSSPQEDPTRDVLVPYRCLCKRKDVICKEIVLEDTDVARAILGFVSDAAIEKLILGAPKGGLVSL